MDSKSSCFKCKQNYNHPTVLSCKHNLCQKCLLRTLLKKHMLELPDKDTITIQCKCKNGSIDLSLQKITDILKEKASISIEACKKHNMPIIKYCKDCKKNLCQKCVDSHSDLFTDHHCMDISEIINDNGKVGNEQCVKHIKDFESYCKTCKVSLCQICLYDTKAHEGHEVISYHTYTSKINDQMQKLQFKSYDTFLDYIDKMEKEFNTNYNNNLSNTTKTLENILTLIKNTLVEYQKKMEIKYNKKNLIMTIIRKVYQRYYDDFKLSNANNSLILLKFLSKPYSEFSELNFHSDFDVITQKLNSIKSLIEKEDISNSVKVSYAYFAKKELKLATKIQGQQKDQINDIIELKDGKIVTASEDNSICVFDDKGTCLYILNGHLSGVRALCALGNNRFASGSADKTVRIWETKNFKTQQILKEHCNPIIAITQLEGNKIATCSFREIIIYDHTFKPTYFLKDHTNWVRNCIQIDKVKVASCSDDGTIKIYDKHFRILNTFKDHQDSVLAICKLRDGRIVSGDRTGKMIIWSKNLSYSKEIKQHTNAILCIKQIKDGRIITGSVDHTVRLWDLDFRTISVFREHSGNVNALCALRDGGLASAGGDCTVNIWR